MRKLLATTAVIIVASVSLPAATAETVRSGPKLERARANAVTLTPAQRFLSQVHQAYQLVGYVELLKAQHQAQVQAWTNAQAQAQRKQRQQSQPSHSQPYHSQPQAIEVGGGRCGGALPPCYVMERESRGDIHAQNPTSTASGKWQFLDSTWQRVTGLSGSASDYSEQTQDAAAMKLWAGGAGCAAWSACG